MTNWWADAANTELAVIWGGNPAENHPGVMQWLNKAVDNGGDVLVIDPRKTRSAVWAESRGGTYVAIRPGTDGALVNGIMNYAITNDLVDWVFLHNYTDASLMLDGNPLTTNSNVNYSRHAASGSGSTYTGATSAFPEFYDNTPVPGAPGTNSGGAPAITLNSSASSCKTYVTATGTVFDYLTTRVSQYTPAVVADICGMTVSEFNTIASKWCAHRGDNNSPAAIFYAMGGTQHTTAGQQLHAKCMLQCMLGNMGKNGGGVNALRGIHNVQGSTDMGVLKDSLPGYYTSTPNYPASAAAYHYDDFLNRQFGAYPAGLQPAGYRNMVWWWFRQGSNPQTAAVGTFTKGTWGSVTNANHDLMPRTGAYNHVQMFQKMKDGTTEACFVLGQNPAVTEPNTTEILAGLYELDTLIVADLYESETAAVPRKGTGVTYLLPSCAHPEESGSVTSSARMLMWRYIATDAQGASKTDLEILLRLAYELDQAGAFTHIIAGAGNAYGPLYGNPEQYDWTPSGATSGVPAAWYDSVGTNTNGQPKYKGEEVAEAVYKQMCGPQTPTGAASAIVGTTADQGKYGTHWLLHGAYDMSTSGVVTDGSTYKYGTKLTSAVAAGASTLTVDHDVTSAKFGGPASAWVGKQIILGQYGMHGSKVTNWPDGGMQTYGYDSMSGLTAGGNEEVVTVSSVTSSTITLTSPTTKDHAAGEAVTQKGFWSYHAGDGMIAKSRATYDPGGNGLFPRFGFAWLLNRRVFYNNNPCTAATQPGSVAAARSGSNYSPGYITYCETLCPNRPAGNGSCKAPGDAYDVFVKADRRATLYVPHSSDAPPIPDYAIFYRSYNTMAETDYPVTDADWSVTNTGVYTAGRRSRYPKHWEPWETPRQDVRAAYGRAGVKPTLMGGNSYSGTAQAGDNALGSVTTYPLVLTTGRICWHFQGGPLSRNNPWLAELDSEPYVILNAVDAGANGIADGDDVYVDTKRGSAGPFVARVGVGPQSTQNVKQGVVWLPWHWGNQGLSTGDPANICCIDSLDSNSLIPESKACLCKIRKV